MSGHFSKRKRYALDVEAWVQFKLLRMAALHPETTKADLAALAEIIQRYKGWSGNGFVSDEEISALAGLAERTVRRARKNLTRLGFVQVVRAGGRGHATVYTPNFSLVPQKADIPVLDKKADIPVLQTDKNVRLNGELQDENVRPSYPQDRFLTGPLRDRLDSAPATPPHAAGLAPASGGAPEEELNLRALLAAYAPADMSKPARAAYKKAWEAIPADTDLAMVIDAAADWHQNPNAPRMSLVRWLNDEMYLKPAPKGFSKVERPAKGRQKSAKAKSPNPTKPDHDFPPGETRLTITRASVEAGEKSKRLMLFMADANGKEFGHIITTEHYKPDVQQAGQDELESFIVGAGFYFAEPEAHELVGRHVVAIVDEDGLSWHGPRDGQPKPEPVAPTPAKRYLTDDEAEREAFDEWCAEQDAA